LTTMILMHMLRINLLLYLSTVPKQKALKWEKQGQLYKKEDWVDIPEKVKHQTSFVNSKGRLLNINSHPKINPGFLPGFLFLKYLDNNQDINCPDLKLSFIFI
jgi:hypothetical protein